MPKVAHDSETLAVGQQVVVACAFIWRQVHDGNVQVLLAKRAASKRFLPGLYELPGGHVEFGESVQDGLKREIQEELGAAIELGPVYHVYDYMNNIKQAHSVEILFLATVAKGSTPKASDDDHSELTWFSENQVRSIVSVNRQDVLKQASIDISTGIDHELEAMYKGFDAVKVHYAMQ